MNGEQYNTLRDALRNAYDSEIVRRVARFFGPVRVTRKADRIDSILWGLEGNGLRRMVDKLDETSKKALAEAAFAPGGRFDAGKFRAKYGNSPAGWDETRRGESVLDLFIINGRMPKDTQARLRGILSPPLDVAPRTTPQIPAKSDNLPLLTVETEPPALYDVLAVLHMIGGELAVIASRSQEVVLSATRTILRSLHSGDFFPIENITGAKQAIRAYSWPQILTAAGFAREGEKMLELTRAGRAALEKPAHEIIRVAWNRWIATNRFDEMERYNIFQNIVLSLHEPSERRRVVVDALKQYPAGEWIEVAGLLRFIQASGKSRDTDMLNSSYARSYFLNYPRWKDLDTFMEDSQALHLHTFLWGYAGTMGVVDVAYTVREKSKSGTASHDFSNLKYVRINALGAYCLGLSETYPAGKPEKKAAIKALPTLEVVVPDSGKTVRWEVFFLDRIAGRISDHVWKLDRKKMLAALEQGVSLEKVRTLLASGEGPLPDTIERFLADVRRRETALRYAGEALLFETLDESTADLIVHERKLSDMCLRAGEKMIAVPGEKKKDFLRIIRKMGYLVRVQMEK